MKRTITPMGYTVLTPKEKAQRVGYLLKNKQIEPKDAKASFHYGRNLYDTSSDEYFNFDPDWSFKQLEDMSTKHGFEPGFDAYNPILLDGFKSPNSHDRSNQKPKKYIYLDKRTKKQVQTIQKNYSYEVEVEGKVFTKKPDFTLSVEERVNYLSELQCCLHHLNYHVNLSTGRVKHSSEMLALLVEILYTEKYWKSTDWYWFYDHLIRRCYSNNFEGDWGRISQLLQVSSNKIACLGALTEFKSTFVNKKGNFSKAQWNDFRKRGKEARNKITYAISLADPVKHKQFKRGFQHGNSGKNPSKTTDDESMNLFEQSSWSRDLTVPPSEKESIVSFLFNDKKPVRRKTLTAEGEYFFKKDLVFTKNEKGEKRLTYKVRNNHLEELKAKRNSLNKTFKEKHKERYKEYFDSITPGEVITYKLSTEQLNLKIQEINQKLKEKTPPDIMIRHLELEKYKNHDTLKDK